MYNIEPHEKGTEKEKCRNAKKQKNKVEIEK